MSTPTLAAAAVFAVSLGDIAQGLGIAVLLLTFLAVGRVKNKDNTIHTLEDECAAVKGLLEVRDKQLKGTQERADREHQKRTDAEAALSKCEGQIGELREYAAPQAFERLIQTLTRLESVIGTAIQEQGELVMKNTEVAATSVEILKSVTKDLAALADRLDGGGG